MQSGPSTKRPELRFTELDSLRGLAALTVVLYHFRMMWFSNGSPPRWLKLANPITAGHEAVMLFFLLSGFVLSIPYLRGKGQPYPVYVLRRILRIYAPYLFALALAVAGAAIWHGSLGFSSWADGTWLHPVNARLVLAHVLMIGNYDWSQYNTAFWSLVVEMRVSIVFPFLFLFVHRLSTRTALLTVAAVTVAGALAMSKWPGPGAWFATIAYAAVFMWGILFATNLERVNAWYRGLGGAGRTLLALAAFILYTWRHLAILLHLNAGFDQCLIALGAAGYMILALNAPKVRAVLNAMPARFLGRISYSLYLVHSTVLFALAHSLGRQIDILDQFLIYLPASLLLAYLFCIGIEEPFLRMSRRVGKNAGIGRTTFQAGIMPAGPVA